MKPLAYLLPIAALFLIAPARADTANVRFYAVLEEGAADVQLDGRPLEHVLDGMIYFFAFTPGAHTLQATTVAGRQSSLEVQLAEDRMATSRGRNWWCIVLRQKGGELELELDTAEQCKALADIAPDEDVPDVAVAPS